MSNNNCPLTTNSVILIVGNIDKQRNNTAIEEANSQKAISIPIIFAAQAYCSIKKQYRSKESNSNMLFERVGI